MFERFYVSLWQHPGLLIVVPAAFWFIQPKLRGFYGLYLRLFLLETVLDALLTAPPPLALPASVATGVAIVFVILGDARYFVLVEAMSQDGAPSAVSSLPAWTRGLLLSLVVPVLQAALIQLFPAWFPTARHTFLAYELLFLGFALGYHVLVLERRFHGSTDLRLAVRSWLRRITLLSLTYYALWISADAIIFAGSDAGYLLRVVPNVLYYGVFVPWSFWSCPPAVRKLLEDDGRSTPSIPPSTEDSTEQHARV